jgi:hypothetical protein
MTKDKRPTYVAQYFDYGRLGEWTQPGVGNPKFRFKARDDDEALDMARSFEKKPQMYFAGIKKIQPIQGARYELKKLYKETEIELTRTSSGKRLEVCVGKNDFEMFI